MRRVKLWLVTICLQLGIATGALAGPLDDYFQASQQFDQWVEKTGTMPRLTDERGAALIATLSDNRRFLDNGTFDDTQLPALMDLCDKANRKVMSYVLFDLRSHVDKSMPLLVIQQAVLKVEQQNIQTYQNELSELQPFQIRCMARQMPLVTQYIEQLKPEQITPVRLSGLEQGRKGIEAVFLGALISASDTLLTEHYRASVLKALDDAAAQLVPVMKPDGRERVEVKANSAMSSAPPSLQDYIKGISDSLRQSTCAGLCKY